MTQTMTGRRRAALALLWVSSLGVALVSYRFLALGLDAAFPGMAAHIAERRGAFLLHVTAGPLALALSLPQFLPRLRTRHPRLHRINGHLCLGAIFVGGGAGLVMAAGAEGGPVAAAGFGLLALAWMGAAGRALWLARQGRLAEHRAWMLRTFALTLAAVTLRMQLPLFMGLGGMSYAPASAWIAWLSWLPNLAVAELYLRRNAGRPPG